MNQLTVLLISALVVSAVSGDFQPPGINFHIEDEWTMVPDIEGNMKNMHISEISEIVDIEPLFLPARDIVYILFTPENPETGHILNINDLSTILTSNFNNANPTRMIIHGWNNDRNSGVNRQLRPAYLNIGAFNVIVVDWGLGANTINYVSARNRVVPSGESVAAFINSMERYAGLNTQTLSVIGYSLGAHIAGVAGKNVPSIINTIIGLDSAGPMFYVRRPDDRLNATDAEYVEAIHTNGGTLGFMDPLGDSDFYPNGGQSQPGCGIDLAGTCAHGRSVEFFAESLSPTTNGFLSRPCNMNEISRGTCTRQGPLALKGGEPTNHGNGIFGIYHLTTRNASPFALG